MLNFKYRAIFFLGIKGVAMANLALIYKKKGISVSGWDTEEEFITDKNLIEAGICVFTNRNFNISNNIDIVVYSAAHGGINNPIIKDAVKKGIKAISQSELISQLLMDFETTIGVSGCHGKTTTSGLLSFVLSKLSTETAHLVGVSGFNNLTGGYYSGKKYFTYEADEYAVDPPRDKTPKFHIACPQKAIVTNIDFDHPDVFDDILQVEKAYFKFMSSVLLKKSPTLVLNGDDFFIKSFAMKNKDKNIILYGKDLSHDVIYYDVEYQRDSTKFKISSRRFNLDNESISLKIFGEKNVSNATAVICMLLELGFKIDDIRLEIKQYTGPARRMELLFEFQDTYLFDDYAHHPQEIEATISAMKNRFPDKRIIAIFQPHTYSRTASLIYEFGNSLARADYAFILPIFASAREKEHNFNISSFDIVKSSNKAGYNNVQAYENMTLLINDLNNVLNRGDVVLLMGAGDVYKLSSQVISLIKNS